MGAVEEIDGARGRRRAQAISKTSVNLPESLALELKDRAEARGDSFTQALKEAVALKLYVDDATADGGRLLIERPDGSLREIVFGYARDYARSGEKV